MEWPLLADLPPDDVRQLLSIARRRTFARGEVVFHRDDPADSLHLVVRGRFGARVHTPLGDGVLVDVLGPGQSFGELALLLPDARRSATIEALEAGETRSVFRDDFAQLQREHPGVKDVLLRLLAEQLRRSTDRLVEAHYVDAETRVRRRLVELATTYDDGVVPLRQEDIAALAGTSRATVNRVLREEEKPARSPSLAGARRCSHSTTCVAGAVTVVPEMSDGRQERKVVTVLFCDLVGFTQRAEEMDPEDVASLLGPYHARLKEELERYGGTVEKFIGDAVMALFGAPIAHEDDPERAVRAALAIRAFAGEEGIELRIGITTGEALVTLGARPDQGETMASGDVVNTAARLQAAAPVNGILVGEKTHEATIDSIEFDEAEPIAAKGKSRPVAAWVALRARSRIALDRLHTSPLVGRARELDLLEDALGRARAEQQPQLVTLVGVPGIGKSRLVYELSEVVDRDSGAHLLEARPLPALRRRSDVLGPGRDRQGAARDSRHRTRQSRPSGSWARR